MSVLIPGARESLTIGGKVFTKTEASNFLIGTLYYGGTANSTFRLSTASAGYQVTAAKTWKLRAMTVVNDTSATSAGNFMGALCYGDNDVGMSTATAFTNQTFVGANANLGTLGPTTLNTTAGFFYWERAIHFNIPATKFAGVDGNNASADAVVAVYGYEV